MNMPELTRLPPLRSGPAALLLLAALFACAPAAAQGTDEERRACTPDVMRLCREYIPSISRITECLIEKRAELNPDCRLVMTPKPAPAVQTAAARHPVATKRTAHRQTAATKREATTTYSPVVAQPGDVIRRPMTILPAAQRPAPRKAKTATVKRTASAAGVVVAAKPGKKKPAAPKIQ